MVVVSIYNIPSYNSFRNVFGIFFNVPELEMKESVILGLIGFGDSNLIAFLLVLYAKGIICGGSQKVDIISYRHKITLHLRYKISIGSRKEPPPFEVMDMSIRRSVGPSVGP